MTIPKTWPSCGTHLGVKNPTYYSKTQQLEDPASAYTLPGMEHIIAGKFSFTSTSPNLSDVHFFTQQSVQKTYLGHPAQFGFSENCTILGKGYSKVWEVTRLKLKHYTDLHPQIIFTNGYLLPKIMGFGRFFPASTMASFWVSKR